MDDVAGASSPTCSCVRKHHTPRTLCLTEREEACQGVWDESWRYEQQKEYKKYDCAIYHSSVSIMVPEPDGEIYRGSECYCLPYHSSLHIFACRDTNAELLACHHTALHTQDNHLIKSPIASGYLANLLAMNSQACRH